MAVEVMAGEQVERNLHRRSRRNPELKARSAARIEALELPGAVDAPSLPGAGRPKEQPDAIRRARATLSWPIENMGPSLPNLLATIAGNLFELKQVSGLRLLDVRLPHTFAEAYDGPKFGIAGTRRLAGVGAADRHDHQAQRRLWPTGTADVVATLCEAGIDFIKDDELQATVRTAPSTSAPAR